MAIDTENKRRSATGVSNLFTVPPVPDGSIGTQDRPHIGLIYAGIVIEVYTLPTGKVFISFALTQPGTTFTSKTPELSFTTKHPEIIFTLT